MHFICRSFIGHPSDNSWSQFWENEPDDPTIVSRRGHLFGLINLSVDEPQASSLGHQIISQINEFYYSSVDNQIIPHLKSTIEHIAALPDYQSIAFSLTLAVVSNDKLYLAIFNSGHCILRRHNKISSLLNGQSGLVVTISGSLLDDDQLFLCTDDFFNNFSWEKIKSYLSINKLEDLEENFLSSLYSLDDQSKLAAALVQIHQDFVTPEPVEKSLPSVPSPLSKGDAAKPRGIFPKFKLSFPHRSNSVYIVHSDSPGTIRRKRINILLSLVILTALFVSSYFGYRRNSATTLEKQYQTLKTELQTKINNALTVKNLNLDTALSLAKESNVLLQKMSPYQKTHATEIKNFQAQINQLLSQTGSSDSFTPNIFFDTSLIDSHLSYSRLTLSNHNLYLLDAVNGRVDQLDIAKKSHQTIINSVDIKDSQFIAGNSDFIYILKNGQIYLIQDKKIVPKITLANQITDFSAGEFQFWNSSLYILSLGTSESSIWKYAPSGTGFSPGQKWLKSGNSLPANPSSLAINGSIWVISKTGVIVPYNMGTKKDFKITATNTFTGVANLVTSADSNVLAFTDQGNQVYVYNKDGQSSGHYNFGTKEIFSLTYDPTTNALYVLCTDQKIYQILL
jgi:hypothetical protein